MRVPHLTSNRSGGERSLLLIPERSLRLQILGKSAAPFPTMRDPKKYLLASRPPNSEHDRSRSPESQATSFLFRNNEIPRGKE